MLGSSQQLLNKDHAEVYYAGMPIDPLTGTALRRHGDEVQRLPGGAYQALGRVDDTMNLGGIKVSSVEIERVVLDCLHPEVSEAAAIGVPAPGGGPEQLVLVLVLIGSAGGDGSRGGSAESGGAAAAAAAGGGGGGGMVERELLARASAAVRLRLSPLFKVSAVVLSDSLPRTASNKVMRRLLRSRATEAVAAAATEGRARPKL
ncbi:hypothetical protein FOA52_002976 [Chlamydomonas sp. UWO 241]|nr:hypothetical protein FOA52_002976 [Chlamydomonas sp. UWO 241]